MLSLVLNLVWLLLAGLPLAIAYAVAGLGLMVTIVGIPFGIQAFKLAGFALWPFGRAVVPAPGRSTVLSGLGNVLWVLLVGWWLALLHLLTGALLLVSIIGIPLGLALLKMTGLAVAPFGRTVVSTATVAHLPPGSHVVTGPANRAG